jgi:hypothetical protein
VSPRNRLLGLGFVAFHGFLILAASLQDVFSAVAGSASALPPAALAFSTRAEHLCSALLAKNLADKNPVRQILAAYADSTGIEAGYSYFAPSVSGNSKLAFELHFPDGHVERGLPLVGNVAAGYRLATLLDRLQSIHYERLREGIVRNLVYEVWREHPNAVMIRAVFGAADIPGVAAYRAGARPGYHVLFAYEFRFHRPAASPMK